MTPRFTLCKTTGEDHHRNHRKRSMETSQTTLRDGEMSREVTWFIRLRSTRPMNNLHITLLHLVSLKENKKLGPGYSNGV